VKSTWPWNVRFVCPLKVTWIQSSSPVAVLRPETLTAVPPTVSIACAVAAEQLLPRGSWQQAPAAVQHAVCAMQVLPERQALSPFGHWHACPGVGHVEPATPAQSAWVQQSLLEMHVPGVVAVHSVSPPGHWHIPPGIGQTWSGTGHDAQHVPEGMHVSLAMQGSMPPGHERPHAVVPATVLHVWLAPQTFQQAPQLLLSLVRFAQ
jgi:hypothetical protein